MGIRVDLWRSITAFTQGDSVAVWADLDVIQLDDAGAWGSLPTVTAIVRDTMGLELGTAELVPDGRTGRFEGTVTLSEGDVPDTVDIAAVGPSSGVEHEVRVVPVLPAGASAPVDLSALQASIAGLESDVADLEAEDVSLDSRVSALEAVPTPSSLSPSQTMEWGRAGTQLVGSVLQNGVRVNFAGASGYYFGTAQVLTRLTFTSRDLDRDCTWRLETGDGSGDSWDFPFVGGQGMVEPNVNIGPGPFRLRLQSMESGANVREPVLLAWTADIPSIGPEPGGGEPPPPPPPPAP